MTPRPVSVNNLGRFCLRPFKFSTLVNKMGLFCLPSYHPDHRPSGNEGSYMDSPPLETTHYPRQRPFSRKVTPSNRGPSTPEAVFRTVNVWSGAGRCKATCHPRLGGACEATGLVPEGQAGVAGAAPARDVKKGVQPMMPRRPPRDAGKTGTTAAQRPGAAATARAGCGELNPKGSPPRPAVAGASFFA